jgi:aldehyde dehydrogenase (NAD+)
VSYPDQSLHWIDDAEVAASGGSAFDKRCPIDDRLLTRVARGGADDAVRAGDAAARAVDAWSRTPAPVRGEILGRVAGLLRAQESRLAEIVQAETGKPWKNALAEVRSSADLGVFMQSETSRLYGKTMTSPIPNRTVYRGSRWESARRSCRSTALAGVAWKVFPALACGTRSSPSRTS